MDNTDKLTILRERDLTISSYLSNGWVIQEDNPNSRQVILRSEWSAGSFVLLFLLTCFYIIPGILYLVVKLSKKKIVNY